MIHVFKYISGLSKFSSVSILLPDFIIISADHYSHGGLATPSPVVFENLPCDIQMEGCRDVAHFNKCVFMISVF